jgi:hypothetical protein
MGTLADDAKVAADWIAGALKSSNYEADYSINSLKEIDRFFDEHSRDGKPTPGGLLSKSLGSRLFALGAYVGECIRRAYGGEWKGDDNDPKGEINISVCWPDGGIVWPVQRVMKRLKNGREDSIHVYGVALADHVRKQA